jgi:hypothetical protein
MAVLFVVKLKAGWCNYEKQKAKDKNKKLDRLIEQKTKIDRVKYGKKKGGKVSSCSKRADGCAVRGKTKGKMI